MQFSGFSPARLLSALLVSVLAVGTAQAKGDGTDLSITIEKEIQTNVVNADGSFVATLETVHLINEERAIKAWAQRSMSYNRTLETLEVVQAYTQSLTGARCRSRPTRSRNSRSVRRRMHRCSRTRCSRW